MLLKLGCVSESLGGLIKHKSLSSAPRVSDSVGLGKKISRICMSNKFPGDADAGGLVTTLENHYLIGMKVF